MEISQITTILFVVAYFLESLINFGLKKENKKLQQKNEKFENVLIEINDTIEIFHNACQELEPEKRGRNCMYCNYGKILQAIIEYEVENEN